MTGLTDRLQSDGLVRRAPHPTDRRLLLLQATAKGRKVRERALGPLFAQLADLGAELAPGERVIVERFLTDISTLLSEHAQPLRVPRDGGVRASAPRRGRSAPREEPRNTAAEPLTTPPGDV
jgi:hypothetical protein